MKCKNFFTGKIAVHKPVPEVIIGKDSKKHKALRCNNCCVIQSYEK